MKIEDAYCYFETKSHRSGKVGEVPIVFNKKLFADFHYSNTHKKLIKNLLSHFTTSYAFRFL